jgi:hypothetical protein
MRRMKPAFCFVMSMLAFASASGARPGQIGVIAMIEANVPAPPTRPGGPPPPPPLCSKNGWSPFLR